MRKKKKEKVPVYRAKGLRDHSLVLALALAILRFEVALEGALDMFPLGPSRGDVGKKDPL